MAEASYLQPRERTRHFHCSAVAFHSISAAPFALLPHGGRMKWIVIVFAAIAIFSDHASAQQQSAAPQTGAWTGFVSDATCGLKIDGRCNRVCFKNGEEPVIVLDGTDEL